MSAHKNTDRLCVIATIVALLLSFLFMNGEAFGLSKVEDADAEGYQGEVIFTENDLDGDWDVSSAVRITLEGDDGDIDGNGAYFLDGDLVIAAPGKYVISGTLDDGSIIVDFEQPAKVRIMLDGVNISCSDDACIRVDEADKVFLTLAEGSENTLVSGETYSEEALADGTGGAIFSHDDLTINGSGSLNVTAGYKHGIESNDDLVITGGSITIKAAADGMHANDSLKITGASVTVDAGDDALHCDTQIYIESGEILLQSCYEGIEAPQVTIDGGNVTIYPEDDGINANGGEDSFAFGPMGEASAESEASSEETDESEEEVTPLITINGGSITIVNETGMDSDGLDSNGDIVINGGTVFVSMKGGGINNALDYGSENGGQCLINGGVVIACAGSAMMEEMSADSGQNILVWVPDETTEDGSALTVTDAQGDTVISREIPVGFSSVIVSSPDLKQGETYTITLQGGDGEETATEEAVIEETVTNIGSAGGMNMTGMPQPEGFQQPGQMAGMGPFGNESFSEKAGTEEQGIFDGTGEKDSNGQEDAGGVNEADGAADNVETEAFTQSSQGQLPQMGGMPGGFGQQEAGRDEQDSGVQEMSAEKGYDKMTWALVWASMAVLAAGIIFARKY